MLVLARVPGQSVVLDDRIVVTVLAARPGVVRLGIEAPDGVHVRRGELERQVADDGYVHLTAGDVADALGMGTRTSDG